VAYNSTESGQAEVYVVPFSRTGAKWQISSDGGAQPRWRGDGRELFYLSPDETMMAVDTQLGTAVTATSPRRLFQTGISVSTLVDQYAVTRDGQRFILMKPVTNTAATRLMVVVNWPTLLKRSS
jgi:eukaryotic-like serine/threonine-protein kinase